MRCGARAAVEAAGQDGISAAPRHVPISWPVAKSWLGETFGETWITQ